MGRNDRYGIVDHLIGVIENFIFTNKQFCRHVDYHNSIIDALYDAFGAENISYTYYAYYERYIHPRKCDIIIAGIDQLIELDTDQYYTHIHHMPENLNNKTFETIKVTINNNTKTYSNISELIGMIKYLQ